MMLQRVTSNQLIPQAKVQCCITHEICNYFKRINNKDSKRVLTQLKAAGEVVLNNEIWGRQTAWQPVYLDACIGQIANV